MSVNGLRRQLTIDDQQLTFGLFQRHKSLSYGISEKSDGSMKLQGSDVMAAKNRSKFFKSHDIRTGQNITPLQSHSATIAKITSDDNHQPSADGLITDVPDISLTVTVADCFPVYFYNPKTSAIGLAHCGWRGIVAGLPSKMAGR